MMMMTTMTTTMPNATVQSLGRHIANNQEYAVILVFMLTVLESLHMLPVLQQLAMPIISSLKKLMNHHISATY